MEIGYVIKCHAKEQYYDGSDRSFDLTWLSNMDSAKKNTECQNDGTPVKVVLPVMDDVADMINW